MSNAATSLSVLVDDVALKGGGYLTLIRDATDACDAIPLILNIAKTLTNKRTSRSKQGIIFLSTRSRSTFKDDDKLHIHPVLSRAAAAATATCVSLDPYALGSSMVTTGGPEFPNLLLRRIKEVAREQHVNLIVIECLYSLKYVFGVDPSAFVRSLISPNTNFSVISACPTNCGIDQDIESLADIADSICDLQDLQTGVATDVNGMLRVMKKNGCWNPASQAQRYRITEASFKIYT